MPAALEEPSQISPFTVAVMAVGTGVSVGNIYYCQPLLHKIVSDLQASDRFIGWIAALTQAGVALGMLLFVPLGDALERRSLTVRMCFCQAATAALVALAPSIHTLLMASFLLGLTGNIPHLILPFAAQLAPPKERGRIVGTVVSGLLIGVLLARTASGLIGSYFGWRAMYWIATALMICLGLLLRRTLPASAPSTTESYQKLLWSLQKMVKTSLLLREVSGTGAMFFGAFNAFWTTLILVLAKPPLHYGERTAGLFGILAAAGAAAAPAVGRLVDQHSPKLGVRYSLLLCLTSFGVLWTLQSSLWGLGLGVILLDIGVQSGHVSNQTRMYAAYPQARSRAATIYMVAYFIGGALGSLGATWGWRSFGWTGVCAVASLMLALGLLMQAVRTNEAEPEAASVGRSLD